MATLTISNIPDHVERALRVQAAESGRSLDETLRQILSKEAKAPALPSRITADEIMRRAHLLKADPPDDDRYIHLTEKELSDVISGVYDDLL